MKSSQRPKPIRPRPLVISSKQFNQILSHLNKGEEKKETTKQDEEYREFLREKSKEMTKTWNNSIENVRLRKVEAHARKKQEAALRDEEYAKKLTDMDESKRQEIIERAEKLIQKNKVGPRSLESAALLSEVLQEREHQLEFRAIQRRKLKKEEMDEARTILNQAKQWVDLTTKKHADDRERIKGYKEVVREQAEDAEKQKLEDLKNTIAHEQLLHRLANEQTAEQKQKLKEIEQRKKVEFKKNMLEAMQIKRDKEKRQKVIDAVELKVIDAYVKGKEEIVKNKRSKLKDMADNSEKIRKIVAEQYEKDQKEILAKQERDARILLYSKASADLEIIEHREKENAKKAELNKAAKLKQQEEFLKAQEEKKEEFMKEIRDEYHTLAINNVVTLSFKKQQKEELEKAQNAVFKVLESQLKEKAECERKAREADLARRNRITAEHLEDDKNFYIYANELMKDVKAKNRSVLPLRRAVESYQLHHFLKIKEKDNRDFLFSKVPIGPTQADRASLPTPPDLIKKYELTELEDLKPKKLY